MRYGSQTLRRPWFFCVDSNLPYIVLLLAEDSFTVLKLSAILVVERYSYVIKMYVKVTCDHKFTGVVAATERINYNSQRKNRNKDLE